MASATSGKLRLEVIEARLTRDTEFIGKMDPYVKIVTREQTLRTKTHSSAGKTPKWNQVFEIDVKYIGDDMVFTVFDEDMTSDDTVGEMRQKISALCITGGIDEWFPIFYKGKQAGQLHLKGNFTPSAGTAGMMSVHAAANATLAGMGAPMMQQPQQQYFMGMGSMQQAYAQQQQMPYAF